MHPPGRLGVAVLAGGMGTRLGGAAPKPLTPILGHPMIHYSLRVFEAIPEVSSIVVAIAETVGPLLDRALLPYPRRSYKGWVPGGPTRPESALAALRALEEEKPEVVLIHDAARPLLAEEDVRALLAALRGHDGAFLGAPAVDTLWQVEGQRAEGAMDRSRLVRAYTPQAFPFATVLEAYNRGLATGFHGTDDASFVRHCGGDVVWVRGYSWNIKVTYPEDVALVESILEGKGCA